MKKYYGSISIYLCIIFLSIIVLISALAEKARVSTIKAKCRGVSFMATESILAGFGKQVFDDYGILVAWYQDSVEKQVEKYMQANINKADLEGPGTNFMDASKVDVADCNIKTITDENGKLFIKQIKSYVEVAGLLEMVEKIVEKSTEYSEKNFSENEESIKDIADKKDIQLEEKVKDISDQLTDIKDVETINNKKVSLEKSKEKNKISHSLKLCKDVEKILKTKIEKIKETNSLIEEYKVEKAIILKENNLEYAPDFLEDNQVILENLVDEIERLIALEISKITRKEFKESLIFNQWEDQLEKILEKMEKLQVNRATEKDKERATIYEELKSFMSTGVLSLVLKDTLALSKNAISTKNLPSNNSIDRRTNDITDKGILYVYSDLKFGNYLEEKKETALKYEIEYLIGGKTSDKENLATVVNRLILVRNTINVPILMTDKGKMAQVEAIASSVAVVTGLPFMKTVAKAVLIEIWSYAEAVYEVRSLLLGNKLKLTKSKEDWKIELENLFMKPEKQSDNGGLTYKDYCFLLVSAQCTERIAYRMMDLIQENIKLRYNSAFRMENCLVQLKVKANFNVSPLFASMPWMSGINKEEGGFGFSISCQNAY